MGVRSAAAETLLHGARFLTQVPEQPEVGALAIRGGRIVAAGSLGEVEAAADRSTRRIDLGGRVVVPGFDDAHTHVWKVGQLLTGMADLRGADSLGELVRRLREAAAALPPGGWLQGRGWNEARMVEGRRPTREDLDRAVPDRPVYLTRTCGHIGVASTSALRVAGVDRMTQPPPGGEIVHDAAGEPTGELHETALSLVTRHIPEPTAPEYETMVLAAARHHVSLGITSATDAGCAPELLEVYRRLDGEGRLPWRVNAMALRTPLGGTRVYPLPERWVSTRLRIDSVKLFADGGLSGATAALSIPYRCSEHRGLMRLTPDELFELAGEAHRAGLRIGIHAIGDVAIEAVLDLFERLQGGAAGPGHRIEHFGLPSPEQLARAARLGVVAVPQAIFLDELGTNFRRYLPDPLVPRAYPLRSMLRAGLVVALSSDAPVVKDDDPLTGMRAAVLRAGPGEEPIAAGEALTTAEALSAYTLGGALATGDGAGRGRLSPGCVADLAVLSGDPLGVPAEELASIRVEETWLGGERVYQR